MPILWILVVVLVLLAIFGGVAVNSLLWLVLIVALVVAFWRCCRSSKLAGPGPKARASSFIPGYTSAR